jgi:hypothetical protein
MKKEQAYRLETVGRFYKMERSVPAIPQNVCIPF